MTWNPVQGSTLPMHFVSWPPSPFFLLVTLSLFAAVLISFVFWYRKRRSRLHADEGGEEIQTLRRIDELIKSRTESAKAPGAKVGDWRQDRGPLSKLGSSPPTPDFSLKPADSPPTLISVPCLESESAEDASQAGDALGRRHAAIWQMADSGLSAEAISSSTGQPIGEIELILGLRRQVRAASSESAKDPRP